MKAIDILRNHIRDLEKMVLVFDEYAMYKSRDESKKAMQELTQVIAELEELEAYKTNYQGVKLRLDSTVETLAVLTSTNESMSKLLTKMNKKMIELRKENRELESRSCENCYESKTCKILHSVYKDRLKKEGYAMHKNEFKCGFWHSLF